MSSGSFTLGPGESTDLGLCQSSFTRPDWYGFVVCCLPEGHTHLHVGRHPNQDGVMVDWAEHQAYRPESDGDRCRALRLDGLRCEGESTKAFPHLGDHWATVHGARVYWAEHQAYRPEVDEPDARSSQVGGDHYSKHKIQPWDIVDEYNLGFYEGSALKYLLRSKTDRLEDLQKARHCLDKAIERVQAEENAKEE